MDFSKLETETGAETGAELHLRHPALGHFLYTGKGADENGKLTEAKLKPQKVCVMVRGTESLHGASASPRVAVQIDEAGQRG